MCENLENRGVLSIVAGAALLAVIGLVPACTDDGGGYAGTGLGGTGGTGGAAGGTSGSGGSGGAGGAAGTGGQPPVDASGDTLDGGTSAGSPLAFDFDGVRKQTTTAAAQILVSGAQQTLRVVGMGGAFTLQINLVRSTAFAPGTYACNPAAGSSSSSLVYSETSPAKSYTSFDSGCSVTLTAVGAVNEHVIGTFQGMVRSGAEAPHAITSGMFDVLRAL